MIPSATRSKQSCVFDAPIEDIWNLLRPLKFKFMSSVKSVSDLKTGAVGQTCEVNYTDGTQQKIRLCALNDLEFSITWEIVFSAPSVVYSSCISTIKLQRITTLLPKQTAKTYIEWTSDYSNDADAPVIQDSNFKKKEAFNDLAKFLVASTSVVDTLCGIGSRE